MVLVIFVAAKWVLIFEVSAVDSRSNGIIVKVLSPDQ